MFVMGVNQNTYTKDMTVRIQRFLHHQLPGSDLAKVLNESLRHRRRPDDHRSLYHRHSEDC